LLESIVIQLKPEGRELIISRFSGIIEQMCFEIGQLTIAMPGLTSSHTAIVCSTQTKTETGERQAESQCSAYEIQYSCSTQQSTPETAGEAINL